MRYQQVYILGDIGGQRAVFEESLVRIGLNPEQPHLPAGTALIQLGDIGRIPLGELDSSGCIELADRLLSYNPRSYYQLLGNHDWAMISEEAPWASHWRESRPVISETVRSWWSSRRIHLALALNLSGRDVLVTHAGLTAGRWEAAASWHLANQLPKPSARAMTKHLNQHVGRLDALFLHPGELVNGWASHRADVLWATQRELIDSWLEAGAMPFDQIHGHESPFNWRTGKWLVGEEAKRRTLLLPSERWAITTLPGSQQNATIMGLDWQLGDKPLAEGFGVYSARDVEITC